MTERIIPEILRQTAEEAKQREGGKDGWKEMTERIIREILRQTAEGEKRREGGRDEKGRK